MNIHTEWIGGGVSMLTTAEIEQCSLDTALIGKRIKKARKEKHQTQEYLAGPCDCTPTHSCNIENGKCKNRRRFATCTEKTCHPAGLFFPPRRRFGHTQPYLSPTFLEWSYTSSQSAETSKTSLSRSDGLRSVIHL